MSRVRIPDGAPEGGPGGLAECEFRPVGQAVKTAASHAVNVGSSPARVTILVLDRLLFGLQIQENRIIVISVVN